MIHEKYVKEVKDASMVEQDHCIERDHNQSHFQRCRYARKRY